MTSKIIAKGFEVKLCHIQICFSHEFIAYINYDYDSWMIFHVMLKYNYHSKVIFTLYSAMTFLDIWRNE